MSVSGQAMAYRSISSSSLRFLRCVFMLHTSWSDRRLSHFSRSYCSRFRHFSM